MSKRRAGRSSGGGLFHEAALDSEPDRLWPEELILDDEFPGQASTQRRHLELSGLLLGLSGDERHGERIADLLDLRGLDHHRARSRWREAARRREKGPVIMSLLVSLSPARDDRLLAAGHAAGLWGRPWRIDPQTGRRRATPLRDPPTSCAVPLSSWTP